MDDMAIYERFAETVRRAGLYAREKQGSVENLGKDIVGSADDSERVKAMRSAKTVIDEEVQEMLLKTAFECFGENIVIDAEEDTPSLSLFPNKEAARSLIIDPIDGTLEYLEGKDAYSVCIALIEDRKLAHTLVYFPTRDKTYGVAPDGIAYEYASFAERGIAAGTPVKLPASAACILYKTRRIPEDFEKRFVDAGFEVRGLDNYVVGLLAVLSGDAAGYIACEPQMRDILIGPVIGRSAGGFMCDWLGDTLRWPAMGRLPQGIFGNTAFEEELRSLLS